MKGRKRRSLIPPSKFILCTLGRKKGSVFLGICQRDCKYYPCLTAETAETALMEADEKYIFFRDRTASQQCRELDGARI